MVYTRGSRVISIVIIISSSSSSSSSSNSSIKSKMTSWRISSLYTAAVLLTFIGVRSDPIVVSQACPHYVELLPCDVTALTQSPLWALRSCWVGSGSFRGRGEVRFVASKRLSMVFRHSIQSTPFRSSLVCRDGLNRCLLIWCTINLSSLSVVTLDRSLLGRSLMFPVCLSFATRRRTLPSVFPKRATKAERNTALSL